MNAPDPRLTDPRVRTTRKPVWENQWDENNIPRPGFTERLAPYDPHPEYSRPDALDGLGDDSDEPLTDIHGYHAIVKTICVTVCIGWWVFVVFAIGFMAGGRYA